MDIQKMLDTMMAATRQARGDYHLTLGRAIEALKGLPQDAAVITDEWLDAARTARDLEAGR